MADKKITSKSCEAFVNRELNWLQFARRVLELAEDAEVPLLERVKFIGIVGMLHDEFFMKRMSGLKRQLSRGVNKVSIDGRTPREEYMACREEVLEQLGIMEQMLGEDIRPELARHGLQLLDWQDLDRNQREKVKRYFDEAVLPILTPLAVDAEPPFPFIAGLGLNLAISIPMTPCLR